MKLIYLKVYIYTCVCIYTFTICIHIYIYVYLHDFFQICIISLPFGLTRQASGYRTTSLQVSEPAPEALPGPMGPSWSHTALWEAFLVGRVGMKAGQIIATSHVFSPQNVAEEGKSPAISGKCRWVKYYNLAR